MKDRRYPEGGASAPTLSFSTASSTNQTMADKLRTQRRTRYLIPTKVKSIRSTTSDAEECLVKREFSDKLQQFMLSYSYTLVTTPVLSGEV